MNELPLRVALLGCGVVGSQVARLILEHGPITASALGERLGLTPAAIRRHLDNLVSEGMVEARDAHPVRRRRRGRPARVFVITGAGRDAFVHGYDDLVLVRDIPFSSHCEHHMVPFIGKAHIGYYPGEDGVIGLSKLARLVEVFARRLQTQEALTAQVIGAIDRHLRPRGCAIMIEASHMCMSMRGVQKQGSITVTHQFTGVFRDDPAEQVRFLTLVRSHS